MTAWGDKGGGAAGRWSRPIMRSHGRPRRKLRNLEALEQPRDKTSHPFSRALMDALCETGQSGSLAAKRRPRVAGGQETMVVELGR